MMISVIVPTFRRFLPLIDTLTDLIAQSHTDYEIIVVDQNPAWPEEHTASVEKMKSERRVRWINLPAKGVVNARQYAASIAEGEIFVFCDDDVRVPDADFLMKHERNYTDSSIDAVCGREIVARVWNDEVLRRGSNVPIDLSQIPIQVQPIVFPRNGNIRQEVCSFCTCNSSVQRATFFALGGFDENFAGASYGDDYDFAIRLRAGGGKIVFDPSAWLIHRQEPAGGLRLSDRRQTFTYREQALSGWLFLLRHGVSRWRAYLLWNWVLRRTIFLKKTLFQPWKIPAASWGTASAFVPALRAARNGPRSRFSERP